MEQINHRQVIILGGGPAGLSAAIYAARADLKPMVVTGMTLYGQASLTHTIENYPGFPQGIGGMELGQLFEEQAKSFGAEIVYDSAISVDLEAHPFVVNLHGGQYTADALIMATGANPRKLDVPGEDKFVGRGVSYCATCDGWFYKDKDIHVVGGGDSALEEALFLTRFANTVTIVHRRDELRAGAILQARARNHPKVKFIWDSVVREVVGTETTSQLLVENINTGEQSIIPTDGLFIFIGHIPNTEWLNGQLELNPDGTIKVDDSLETSVHSVFAAGEVADPMFRQVVTSAGMGAAAAISATHCIEAQACAVTVFTEKAKEPQSAESQTHSN